MPQFSHSSSGEPQLSFWGPPGHSCAVGGGHKELANCLSLAGLAGERQETSLPFPKRLWRAEATHPGTQGQARAGKAAWVGEISARVSFTRPTFLFKYPPCPCYPYSLLSWCTAPLAPAPLKADATRSQSSTLVPLSMPKHPNPAGYPPTHHTRDPTSSTSTSSGRAAPARQCPTTASTFPRRRSSARRWGSARTGARGSVASASRSRSLRR